MCDVSGQIERQLFHRGLCSAHDAAQTLINAITVSAANEHDLRLLRLRCNKLCLVTGTYLAQGYYAAVLRVE